MRFLSKYFVQLLIFHKDAGTWNQDDDASDPGSRVGGGGPIKPKYCMPMMATAARKINSPKPASVGIKPLPSP